MFSEFVVSTVLQLGVQVIPGPTDCPTADWTKRETVTRSIPLGPLESNGALVTFSYSGQRLQSYRSDFASILQGSNTQPWLILKDRQFHRLYRWLSEQPLIWWESADGG